jgi:iron complex outermembrane receptor protein
LRHHLYLFLLTFIVLPELHAQEKDSIAVALQPIVITANRIPTNALYVSRSIDVIDQQMITSSGAVSVEELLQIGSNVHVQPRGIFGVQSDVSVRGASFSQQLILLNGVRMNDAQTAHHNFDLPLPVEQIERIEVLKGAGSALYGPDAYGGIINIITRTPERQALRLNLSGGENGFVNTSGDYDLSASGIHSSNVIEHRRSDGYHEDTDFRITSFSSNNILELPFGNYSLFGGYTNKEFGAFNFYGPSPSKEWTETTFLSLKTDIALPSLLLQPKVSYRKHYDKFMYDIRTPGKFVNIHTTNSYSGELQAMIPVSESFSLISGVDGNADYIASTNLHNHKRAAIGLLLAAHGIIQDNFIVDVGVRNDFHSEYGNQLNPTVSLGYLFLQDAKVFVTAGRSFRAPSYTELYYTSASRIGNADLKPEIGWSYEIGAEYAFHPHARITTSLFERDQTNLIDYVKLTATDPAYHAANFTAATTRGAEFSFRWQGEVSVEHSSTDNIEIQSIFVSYTYLDSHIDVGNIFSSIYSFTHPKHQLSAVLSGHLPFSIIGTTSATYKIKLSGTNYTLIDAKLSRMFSNLNVFIQGTNLLNQSYEEIVGVPLPGRWLWGGLEYKIF